MPAKPNYKGKRSFPYQYLETLEKIQRDTGKSLLDIFISFVTIVAGVYGSTPAIESKEHERWKKEHMVLFEKALNELCEEMQCNHYKDLLGEVYISLKYKGNGEFYTPKPVCDCMAGMGYSDIIVDKSKPLLCIEPTCGAGLMILSAWEVLCKRDEVGRFDVIFKAQDLDLTACYCCYINTTAWGIPCIVVQGNTLLLEENLCTPNVHYLQAIKYWTPILKTKKLISIVGRLKEKTQDIPKHIEKTLIQKSIIDFL